MFRNHGIDPVLRWQVMHEKVLAVKDLWTQPEAEFHGRFVSFEPVVRMRPFQLPHPPILVGSHGARGLRHVIEYCDEWFPVLAGNLDLEQDMRELTRLRSEGANQPASRS